MTKAHFVEDDTNLKADKELRLESYLKDFTKDELEESLNEFLEIVVAIQKEIKIRK